MRSVPLAFLFLTSFAFGLDLKPSLVPTKPASGPARVAPPAAAPVAAPKAEGPKEPEAPPVIVAKFTNAATILPEVKAIQIPLVGFVDRGSHNFLDFKLVGAVNGQDAVCHVRLLDEDGKPIGYLKAYLHEKGYSFDLAGVEKDPAKRKVLLAKTQAILIQGVDKTQGVLSAECRRLK